MRARVKFLGRPRFNYGNGRFGMPACDGDVPATMKLWTMTFKSSEEISRLEHVGDLTWLADPLPGGELKPGFRFYLWDGQVVGEGVVL